LGHAFVPARLEGGQPQPKKIYQGKDRRGNNFNGSLLPIPLTIIPLTFPAFFVPPIRVLVLVAALPRCAFAFKFSRLAVWFRLSHIHAVQN
jgi:hypothetical protein